MEQKWKSEPKHKRDHDEDLSQTEVDVRIIIIKKDL